MSYISSVMCGFSMQHERTNWPAETKSFAGGSVHKTNKNIWYVKGSHVENYYNKCCTRIAAFGMFQDWNSFTHLDLVQMCEPAFETSSEWQTIDMTARWQSQTNKFSWFAMKTTGNNSEKKNSISRLYQTEWLVRISGSTGEVLQLRAAGSMSWHPKLASGLERENQSRKH